MIPIYTLIKWQVLGDSRKFKIQTDRVLGIDQGRDVMALIAMNDRKASIRKAELGLVLRKLEAGDATIVEGRPSIVKVTEGTRAYRESLTNAMYPFKHSSIFLFDCHERYELIKMVASQHQLSEQTVRSYLTRYLQAAGRIEEIGCDYSNCGTPKAGRRFLSVRQGAPKLMDEIESLYSGEPLTDEEKEKVRQGIEAYVVGVKNRYHTREHAHRMTLTNYFRDVVVGPNGSTRVFNKRLPSPHQFRQILESVYTEHEIRRSHLSPAGLGTSERRLMSLSGAIDPVGPGDVYQVDSTTADIYLVNSQDARISIGRPTLYLVVDVWSGMIVGFNLTLNAPSYEEACVAMVSVLEDKEALCRRLGVIFEPEWWHNSPFCSVLVADKQELFWGKSDILAERTGISILNPPAYRGDLKGLIESCIGTSMRGTQSMPGSVDKKACKDESAPEHNAVYTLQDYLRIVVINILAANRRTKMDFPMPKAAADSKEPPLTPAEFFQWGTWNLSGTGLAMDSDSLARAALPLAQSASSTRRGIRISVGDAHRIYFDDVNGDLPSGMFQQGGFRSDLKVQFDTRSMARVIVEHPDTGVLIVCYLSNRYSPQYSGWSWAEGAAWQVRRREAAALRVLKALENFANDHDQKVTLTNDALAARLDAGPITKAEARRNISHGREIEKEQTSTLLAPRIPEPFVPYNPLLQDSDD